MNHSWTLFLPSIYRILLEQHNDLSSILALARCSKLCYHLFRTQHDITEHFRALKQIHKCIHSLMYEPSYDQTQSLKVNYKEEVIKMRFLHNQVWQSSEQQFWPAWIRKFIFLLWLIPQLKSQSKMGTQDYNIQSRLQVRWRFQIYDHRPRSLFL